MDELDIGIAERLDTEVPGEAKLIILRVKLQTWFNTIYDAQVDTDLAKLTDNEPLLNQAQARLKEAIQTIHVLEERIKGLEEDTE